MVLMSLVEANLIQKFCEITFYHIKDMKMKHETKRPKQKYLVYNNN